MDFGQREGGSVNGLCVAVILFFGSTALAGTTGRIAGYVRDKASGEPVIGATVSIASTKLGASTDVDGFYRIDNVPAGPHEVQCSFIGFRTVITKSVYVKPDLKTTLDIELEESTIELGDVVIVAEPPLIQKDVTGTTYSATSETFTALPVSDVSDIIGLQPGTTAENNIRGGKTTEVVYLLDGLPVQDLIEGGAGSISPQSSIADIAIQTGGFDAEYGNALSGVINVITKRPGEQHSVSMRAEADDLWGGEQVDHRGEVDMFASGPIVSNLSYVGSVDVILTDTRWWQDLSHFYDSPISTTVSGLGKLDYQPSSVAKLTGQFLYSYNRFKDYEFTWRFNLDGLPARKQEGYRGAILFNHTLSKDFFYTASFSRYVLNGEINDSDRGAIDTTLYQWDFFLQYIVDGNRSWWARNSQAHNMLKADGTLRVSDQHVLKFGGEFTVQEIEADIVRYEPVVNVFGKPFVNKPLLNYSTDYRYFPRMGNVYLQDKMELSKDGMLLNIGLRYEFLDPRAERPTAERVPLPGNEYETRITGFTPASVKHLFSPRIGFAAPFSTQGYLFINYGVYYQFPLFDYLYSGLNNTSLKSGVGVLVGNPDLKPERTRSWEMSIRYALKNKIVLAGTYFHKETTNLIDVKTFVPTNARVAGDYGFAEFVNSPYALASGIELSVAREEGGPLTGSLSYTYMNAEGISENARGGLQYYQWGIAVPGIPYPLSWDQRHTVKATGLLQLPWEMLLSVTWVYHSGRPYTYYPSSDGFTPDDPDMEFEPNNARLEDYNLLNAKLSKSISFGANEKPWLRMNIYLDTRNVFNERNVRWADSAGRVGGELGDLTAGDAWRRVRLGLRAEI